MTEQTEPEKKYWHEYYTIRERMNRLIDLNIDLTIAPEWVKYNLGLSGIFAMDFSVLSDDEVREYAKLVWTSHHAVADYLDNHQEEQEPYAARSSGHLYFDILKRAAPDLSIRIDEWIKTIVIRGLNRNTANGIKPSWK